MRNTITTSSVAAKAKHTTRRLGRIRRWSHEQQKRRDQAAASLPLAFGHVVRKRGSRHGLSNVVDDTSGHTAESLSKVSAENSEASGTLDHLLEVLHLP